MISCLRDPCKPGEHKYKDLSDTLKSYRLWKSSADIFSELLQNWATQGEPGSEDQWLKLLETQKSVHDSIVSFLFEFSNTCSNIISALESNDNGLKDLVGSNHSNLLAYRDLKFAFHRSALVWIERGRARTLMAQLGPWYNTGSLKEDLIDFYKDEEVDCCCYMYLIVVRSLYA